MGDVMNEEGKKRLQGRKGTTRVRLDGEARVRKRGEGIRRARTRTAMEEEARGE